MRNINRRVRYGLITFPVRCQQLNADSSCNVLSQLAKTKSVFFQMRAVFPKGSMFLRSMAWLLLTPEAARSTLCNQLAEQYGLVRTRRLERLLFLSLSPSMTMLKTQSNRATLNRFGRFLTHSKRMMICSRIALINFG